jgi:hypothetical protein
MHMNPSARQVHKKAARRAQQSPGSAARGGLEGPIYAVQVAKSAFFERLSGVTGVHHISERESKRAWGGRLWRRGFVSGLRKIGPCTFPGPVSRDCDGSKSGNRALFWAFIFGRTLNKRYFTLNKAKEGSVSLKCAKFRACWRCHVHRIMTTPVVHW